MTRVSRVRTLLGLAAASAAVVALAACSSGAPEASGGASAAGDEYGLVKAGTLTVATEGTYRPFSFHEDGSGELSGYDVEVAEAVAEKLGVEIEFQETQWDAIFAGLDAGRFDVDREPGVDQPRSARREYVFSTPYTVSTGVIVVQERTTTRSRASTTSTARPPRSRSRATGTSSPRRAARTVEAVEGWAQAVALLEQGRVDATINDKLTYLDYATTEDAIGHQGRRGDRGRVAERASSYAGATRPTRARRSTAPSRSCAPTARSPSSARSTSAPTSPSSHWS